MHSKASYLSNRLGSIHIKSGAGELFAMNTLLRGENFKVVNGKLAISKSDCRIWIDDGFQLSELSQYRLVSSACSKL